MNDGEFRRLMEGRVPDGAMEKLVVFAGILQRWSARQSLVRFSSPRELVERHLVESLEALKFTDGASGVLLDIGSGAGLPGIPLLCAVPGLRGVLLEPRLKRWAFLRHVLRELSLDGEVRRETWEEHRGTGFSLVTSRALGGQVDIAAWAAGRLKPDGRVLFWATETEEEKLRGLSGWNVVASPIAGLGRGRLISMKECFT